MNQKIRFLNSFTSKLEELRVENGKLTVYICGPTVYDQPHLGHARTYLSLDVIRRILKNYFKIDTEVVMNVTDIDDKIIRRTKEKTYYDRFCSEVLKRKEETDAQEIKELLEFLYVDALERCEKETKKLKAKLSSKKYSKQQNKAIRETLLSLEFQKERTEKDREKFAQEKDSFFPKELLEKNENVISAALLAFLVDEVPTVPLKAIIQSCLQEKIEREAYEKLASKFRNLFFAEMEKLGVSPVDKVTNCTEYVPKMVAMIDSLEKGGFAYRADDRSVYFDVNKYRAEFPYGVFCKGEENCSVENGKRTSADFVLWKSVPQTSDSIAWDSPFGPGRPGWHIECSAMSVEELGESLGLHCGGVDLKFPHHENELAQCRAFLRCRSLDSSEWCSQFLHTGHLHIKGQKMSKSLKNFLTISEVLEKATPTELRVLFLTSAEYGKTLNFEFEQLLTAKTNTATLAEFLGKSQGVLHRAKNENIKEYIDTNKLEKHFSKSKQEIDKHFRNDFAYSRAFKTILGLVERGNKLINQFFVKGFSAEQTQLLEELIEFVQNTCQVLGVNFRLVRELSDTEKECLTKICRFREAIRKHYKKNISKEDLLSSFETNLGKVDIEKRLLKEHVCNLEKKLRSYKTSGLGFEEILNLSDDFRVLNIEGQVVVIQDGATIAVWFSKLN